MFETLDFSDHEVRVHDFLKLLDRLIKEKFGKVTNLSKLTGISSSKLTKIFSLQQSISLDQLDTITLALGLEPGAFYEYYVSCCFTPDGVSLSKLIDFLPRLRLLGKSTIYSWLDCLLVDLLPNPKACKSTFLIAENLYHDGHSGHAMYYYNLYLQHASNFTDRSAICLYRIYLILRLTESEDVIRQAFHSMLSHVHYLPVEYVHNNQISYPRLDALHKVVRYYHIHDDWSHALHYSLILERESRNVHCDFEAESLLYKAAALKEQGRLNDSIEICEIYSQFGPKYRRLSEGNRLLYSADFGDLHAARKLEKWMDADDEILVILPTLVTCYTDHGYLDGVDRLLSLYPDHFSKESYHETQLLHLKRKLRYDLCLSKYNFKLGNSSLVATDHLVKAASTALKLRNHPLLVDCFRVFVSNISVIDKGHVYLLENLFTQGR